MKKLTLALLICTLFISISYGQTGILNKGNFLIGGTLGFSTSSSSLDITADGVSTDAEGARSTLFNISPSIGYFFVDRFALGIGLDYTLQKVEEPRDGDIDITETLNSDLLFGPFARYYLPVSEDKSFFLEATFGFGTTASEFDGESTITNVSLIGIGPGFTIFSNDAIGIEALVKYNFARSKTDVDVNNINTEIISRTNQVDFSVGFQVYFTRMTRASNS